MNAPANPIKPSTRRHVVGGRFSRLLADGFGVAPDAILTALEGEPQKRAIGICEWASLQNDLARGLLCWARKHRRGRCRRAREVSGRPRTNTRRHVRGRDAPVRRDIPPERRDNPLRGVVCDPDALDRIAAKLGV